jgi:hypothetical protein
MMCEEVHQMSVRRICRKTKDLSKPEAKQRREIAEPPAYINRTI